jgi:hypothetical protein
MSDSSDLTIGNYEGFTCQVLTLNQTCRIPSAQQSKKGVTVKMQENKRMKRMGQAIRTIMSKVITFYVKWNNIA